MTQSLADKLQSSNGAVELLRSQGVSSDYLVSSGGYIPPEFTNWREEQRAWTKSVVLMDQSEHMVDLEIEGPDALELLSDLGVNDFTTFGPGNAKQFVACNSDGYLIGDGILYCLAENTFDLVGAATPINWVEYNLETGNYEATAERDENALGREGPPKRFRYEVQGPNALDVIREAADGPLPDVNFFNFDTISIDGIEVNAARHGMLNEAGFEFFGPWEDGGDVKDAILDAGEAYDLKQVGMKVYFTSNLNGWVSLPLPAIWGDEMQAYREWLPGDGFEAMFSIGGSFKSDDIRDYYLTPFEVGYGRFIDYDHDFVGREALREMRDDDHRTKVTLLWDRDEVSDVFGRLFEEPTAKYMELPRPHYGLTMYDRVEKDGETVGISKYPAYRDHVQEMMSWGIIDSTLSEPGTEVTVVWGEEDSPKPQVEDHEEVDITATVAEMPYQGDRRKTTDYSTA